MSWRKMIDDKLAVTKKNLKYKRYEKFTVTRTAQNKILHQSELLRIE
jgi:hypothetical protein